MLQGAKRTRPADLARGAQRVGVPLEGLSAIGRYPCNLVPARSLKGIPVEPVAGSLSDKAGGAASRIRARCKVTRICPKRLNGDRTLLPFMGNGVGTCFAKRLFLQAKNSYLGSGGRDRTYDQLINSQLLYR